MQLRRLTKLSAFQAVADLFRLPPPSSAVDPSWPVPWAVLSAKDLLAGTSPSFFPFIYMVDIRDRDLPLQPPVIVIDASNARHYQLDLGNLHTAKMNTISFHCIGRNKGESEDLSSFIANRLRYIKLLDYNNPVTPGNTWPTFDTRPAVGSPLALPAPYFPTLTTLQLHPNISEGSINVPPKEKVQGMLLAAELVIMAFNSPI